MSEKNTQVVDWSFVNRCQVLMPLIRDLFATSLDEPLELVRGHLVTLVVFPNTAQDNRLILGAVTHLIRTMQQSRDLTRRIAGMVTAWVIVRPQGIQGLCEDVWALAMNCPGKQSVVIHGLFLGILRGITILLESNVLRPSFDKVGLLDVAKALAGLFLYNGRSLTVLVTSYTPVDDCFDQELGQMFTALMKDDLGRRLLGLFLTEFSRGLSEEADVPDFAGQVFRQVALKNVSRLPVRALLDVCSKCAMGRDARPAVDPATATPAA